MFSVFLGGGTCHPSPTIMEGRNLPHGRLKTLAFGSTGECGRRKREFSLSIAISSAYEFPHWLYIASKFTLV